MTFKVNPRLVVICTCLTASLHNHYQIIGALTGKAGLAKEKGIVLDLIISDVMMPEILKIKALASFKAQSG